MDPQGSRKSCNALQLQFQWSVIVGMEAGLNIWLELAWTQGRHKTHPQALITLRPTGADWRSLAGR